ncbi:PQQ-binding-like beta-propeller repeat protein [Vibrio sp. ZSDE26]|uniref:PQQ-binding-like beta-propeller repeat protein n=1 Tax=Vibrio amylolyticus TaxID=2847292 RepID=A0A9X1XNS2_9VIBR|nr:PQQ-binding-like beta-propeller repeat protein [Vibrio amylolyticus]MCK6265845.1 PQQ-binding-like beta-propeller repeat protein [Vibrio amylolyticus]
MVKKFGITLLTSFLILWGISSSAQDNVPTPLNSDWHFETNGSIWSSIIIDEGIAFFGSDDEHVYAVNVDTKSLLWAFKTKGKVRSTAAIDSDSVYFSSDDGYLYSLSKKAGELKWKSSLNDGDVERIEPAKTAPYRYDFYKSSPLIINETIYVGSGDSHLYAISAKSGEVVWKFKTGSIIRSTPAYSDGLLYVGSFDYGVYAIDANTGKQKWLFYTNGIINSSPAVIEGKVIIGSRDTSLYALDAQSGEEKWRYRFVDRSWVESSATQSDERGVFYIGSSDSKRVLKIDINTGKEIWSSPTLGWTWGKPFYHQSQIFIGSTGAKGYWNDVNPGFLSIDAKTGTATHQYTPQKIDGYVTGGVFGSPSIFNDKLYVPDLDGRLYEFDL